MAITQLTASTAIIATLADLPNATSGLTAAQLKAKFDEAPTSIKTYINNTLIPEIETATNNYSDSIINVKSYKASGSAQTTTGSITSGLTALTVAATTTFVQNQGISVAGAGAAGATLVTTIASISSLVITLADAASTTVAGAVVSHNDTAAIQAAINAAIAAGAKAVFFPNGTYLVTSLNNLSSVVLFGDNATFSGITTNIYQLGINPSQSTYAADVGTTDGYAVTLSPAPKEYFTGMTIKFKANTANAGGATLNVNSLGAKTITKDFNQALVDGDIKSQQIVEVVYDGTNFQVQSPMVSRTQEAWIAPTLLNSWVNFGTTYANSGYYKDNFGAVRLRGLIKSGTTTAGTSLFTLPAGYRPLSDLIFSTFSSAAGTATPITIEIISDGTVKIGGFPAGSTYLTLSGITFRAE